MNLHLVLQMAAESFGDRVAVTCGDASLTFAELDRAARKVAAKLAGHERAVWLAENHPAFPAALFGSALAGKPFVSVNYRLAADRIETLLAKTAPALLISEDISGVAEIETCGREAVISGTAVAGEAASDPGTAVELFTSGTTGDPKAAILRHANLMAYILSSVEFMSAHGDEATLIAVPPYHIAGISAVLSSTYAGRRMVQLPSFSAEAWLTLAKDEQVTHAFLVPTMLQQVAALLERDAAFELPHLRAISYGGGRMPLRVIAQAMELLPEVDFTNAYGLTETSSTICLLGPDDHRDARASDDPDMRKRLSSVGRPIPGIALEVRREDGNSCGIGERGLVFVRGEQVAGGYQDIGSQLDEDGWFATQDLGYVDAGGYLFLDGRVDDVIVRGGENISPGEVEEILMAHPLVEAAAAVAVHDEHWGEAVGAVLVCLGKRPEEDEIREHVRAHLRSSRVPSRILFVDALPYNETGKLLRRDLREQIAAN